MCIYVLSTALVGPYWEKLCPRAKFGRFQVQVGGSIEAVKLVHLSGQASCLSQEISRSKGDVKGRTHRFFEQTHPTPFFYWWVKVLVTPFRAMMHSQVKLSSVASQIHSIFPQVNNYGCGTRRILMIKVNLIMVEPRALMFLSSICRHNAEHLLLFFLFILDLAFVFGFILRLMITR